MKMVVKSMMKKCQRSFFDLPCTPSTQVGQGRTATNHARLALLVLLGRIIPEVTQSYSLFIYMPLTLHVATDDVNLDQK